MPLRVSLSALALALALSACSGGGSDSNPPPAPTNRAPAFSPAQFDASVAENSTDPVTSAEASDPDGDALSYSLIGEDAGAFTVTGAGVVSFATAPDFEAPADSNGDNEYSFSVRASDPGGLTGTLTVTVTVTNVAEPGDPERYLDLVFTNVDVETGIAFATIDGQTLLMDIYTPRGDTETQRPVMIAASGGGFTDMDRTDVAPIAENFARRGYVAAAIDYRVLGREPADADELAVAAVKAVHDMFAAVRFLRAEAEDANARDVLSDTFFVSGESAGAVMSMLAVTLDPADAQTRQAVADYLAANGGVYGNVGDNDGVSSRVQGAMPLSGGILDLASVDAQSGVLFAAHEEFDPVVPCKTAAEGASFTGLVISGSCDVVPAYTAAGARAELFLIAGSAGHVEFTEVQRRDIYQGAAGLFFETVISPPE